MIQPDQELTCQRALFDLPGGQHYLNCAYMAPLSRRVVEAGATAVRSGMAPGGIVADDFFRGGDRVRALFAELIGLPEPDRIALVPSVSYGLAVVARNTVLERHQNVVTLREQFPSNVHTWRRLCEEAGAELRVVSPPVEGHGRSTAWNEAILEAIDRNTQLVAIGSVHWTDGTSFDLDRVGARARDVGAAFVIDGTQSVGAAAFDVTRIRPDALVCAGYKWLMGPYSLGVAYLGDRYQMGVPLEETWMGKKGSNDFASLGVQGLEYRQGAARFEVGESANFILVPMLIAALAQLLEWGVANVASYVRGLRDEFSASPRLSKIGIEVGEGSAHLFGLHLPQDRDAELTRALLQSRGVHVSVRGRVVRVAPHAYNDMDDMDALLRGLEASVV